MGKLHRGTGFIVVALALTLTACTDDRPTAEDAAATLAAGLARLDVGQSAFVSAPASEVTDELATITEDFAPGSPEVSVAGVEETGEDIATATLDYVWHLDATDRDWTYSTTAELTRVEDGWQTAWNPAVFVQDLLPEEKLSLTSIPADRGDITGAGGEVIVTERPVLRVGIDKTQVSEAGQDASARELASLLDLDPDGYADEVAAAGDEAFVVALVVRDDADREVTDAQIDAIEGALAQPGTLELGPTRTFARELLGSVGEATEELVAQSDGALEPGDITGLSGLQLQHDAQLTGLPGLEVSTVSTDTAAPTQRLFAVEPVAGTDLATTLDPRLQTLGEQILADEPSASSIVALRPSTGEILAIANGPGSEGFQTALLGQYPPGSTFKVATTLALLRNGFTAQSPTECTEEVDVDGRSFNNAGTYPDEFLGTIELLETFAQSCNTGFIAARNDVTQAELAAAAQDLGIGVPASIGTPAFFGDVPIEAEGTAHAASMIGQGRILVSPLSLATMAASVGAGERVTPTLLAPGGATTPDAEQSDEPAPSSFTSAEAESLRSFMGAVVEQGGAQLLQDVPGEPVLAKTGTAEFGSEDPPRTHAWVIALQGDLAVAVFVEEGELGSTSGGPLMQEFLTGAAS
ncbi:penicillin-binding transpeptidase domain-containing protein [Arthrobacter echini]|nr:penicillin-binding transpeptidase domain-containing protein [Arthrobacter echini]